MTDFLVTPPSFDISAVMLTPTLYQNLSLTTPLLKAVGPGEEELAACEFLYNIHPEMYKEHRITFELSEAEAERYRLLLRSVDDSFCEFRTLVNTFVTFLDPTEAPYPILPLLAPIVGIDFNFDVPEEVARREIINAIFLWERKGTRDNTSDWIEFITGFRVRIREFYKEVLRSNVWGQSYRDNVRTTRPTVWRESWDTFYSVPSLSLSRVIPPTVWEEDWERVVTGDPYATLPHLDEHHATNTWNGTNVLRPFYNFSMEDDINYGVHGFTQTRRAAPDDGETLNGFLFRNHVGVYIDVNEIDLVDTIDDTHDSKPLTVDERINDIYISTGLRVIFTALEDSQADDNGLIWEATVDLDGDITWALHTTTSAEIGIDFTWFDTPFLEIILAKVGRILDLITFYGIVNHLFWRLVSEEDAYLCHQYQYQVVPHIVEGWGKLLGDDVENLPDIITVTQTTNCDAVEEEDILCYGDTYNIDIGNAFCCVTDEDDCVGRLATFVLCANNPEETTNAYDSNGIWLTYYQAKYWSHQVDDILQEWVPDTDGVLYLETTIPAEFSLAEVFINPLIGTGTGQGSEVPTSPSDYIYDACFNGVFDIVIIEEEWNDPFSETLILSDNWNYTATFDEDLIITDDWNLPDFDEDLIYTDDWEYSVTFDEDTILVEDWESDAAFEETFVIYDDWEDNLPMLIPDDEIWLDGNNGPMANSPVGLWRDRSGGNNDATQSTGGNQPNFTLHDADYNDFGTVTFDGVDDYMTIADDSGIDGDQFTFFVVGHWDTPINKATFVSKVVDETLTAGGWGLMQPGASGNALRFFVDDITTHYIEYTLPDNTPVIIKCEYDQTELRMWVNGTAITSAFSLYGGGVTNSATELFVGAYRNGSVPPASGYLPGTVAEFAYYSRVLTEPEELSLWLYFSEKYGIPVVTEFEEFTENWDFDTTYSSSSEVDEPFDFDVTYTPTEEVDEPFDVTLSYSETTDVAEGWDTEGTETLLVHEDWEVPLGEFDHLDPLLLVWGKFRPL